MDPLWKDDDVEEDGGLSSRSTSSPPSSSSSSDDDASSRDDGDEPPGTVVVVTPATVELSSAAAPSLSRGDDVTPNNTATDPCGGGDDDASSSCAAAARSVVVVEDPLTIPPHRRSEFYLSIHFEQRDPTSDFWTAAAAVVAEFPSGRILDRCIVSNLPLLTRPISSLSSSSSSSPSPCSPLLPPDVELCTFVRAMHARYPLLRIVSDHAIRDFRLINNLLVRFHWYRIEYRECGTYAEPLDSRSYRLGHLGTMGSVSNDKLSRFHDTVFGSFRVGERRDVNVLAESTSCAALRVACRTLLYHFFVLDMVSFYRQFPLRPRDLLRVEEEGTVTTHTGSESGES